jgi:hypothetical protein
LVELAVAAAEFYPELVALDIVAVALVEVAILMVAIQLGDPIPAAVAVDGGRAAVTLVPHRALVAQAVVLFNLMVTVSHGLPQALVGER